MTDYKPCRVEIEGQPTRYYHSVKSACAYARRISKKIDDLVYVVVSEGTSDIGQYLYHFGFTHGFES